MDLVQAAQGTPRIPDRELVALAKGLGYNQPKDILTDTYIEDRAELELIVFHTRNREPNKAKNLISKMKKRAIKRNADQEITENMSSPEQVLKVSEQLAQMEAEEALEAENAPRDPNDQSPTGVVIDIDKKRLDRLEWELATDPKSIEMLNETVQHFVQGDMNAAKQLFEKLKKRQPRTSAIHAGSVKALVLALKRAKLIEAIKA